MRTPHQIGGSVVCLITIQMNRTIELDSTRQLGYESIGYQESQ